MNIDGTITAKIAGHPGFKSMRLRVSTMGEPMLGLREAELLRGGNLRTAGRPKEDMYDFIGNAASFLQDYEVKGYGLSCVYLQRKVAAEDWIESRVGD